MWFSFSRIKETVIHSEKNGQIVLRSVGENTEVYVNDFDQSSDYIVTMWRRALWHLPRVFSAQRVLVFGLGGGSIIHPLQQKYPGCDIVVVEWDPVMINLYHRLCRGNKPIRIIEGDATLLVSSFAETFDLVVVDLFTGNQVPEKLGDHPMIEGVSRLVASSGFCLLNAFDSLHLLPVFDEYFSQKDKWSYKYNTLVLYE